jgi:hypothetical protein
VTQSPQKRLKSSESPVNTVGLGKVVIRVFLSAVLNLPCEEDGGGEVLDFLFEESGVVEVLGLLCEEGGVVG